ncbi:AAA family ATPase [Kitasatospora acidiphila]|uniref:AAA family ATPase n=1 Tax=Kitasatospora acidiphila TaxID=2567942 RepID=A0A540W1Z0_9ACTN|nr:LuxR family transcriptional regulator [Kitasatospora acidiphila]TQF03035.1 AAA family ATPase [Kitasatospora acidiphila]
MATALCGRDDEQARLDLLVQQVAAGQGRAMVLRGEPGIGKSAMLDVAETLCRGAGISVLRGQASEMDHWLPFAALSDCLGTDTAERPGLARIRSLMRGDERVGALAGAAGQEFLIAEAILSSLDDWCSAGPVALLVDDVHWADAASLAVIHRLARALDQLPLLVLLTSRPAPEPGPVSRLLLSLEEHKVPTVTLGPLDEDKVAELVAELTGVRPGDRLRELVAGAAGNPLYVIELISARAGADGFDAGSPVEEVDGGDSSVPGPLNAAIFQRLGSLSAGTREMLKIVALLGRAFSAAEMTAVLQRPVTELLTPVAEAIAAGVLEERGGLLAFRHDLIRRVVVQSYSHAVRTALHQQIGVALAAMNAPVERVAEHLLETSQLSERDVEWLRGALDSLLVRAPRLAVELLHRARDRSPSDELDFELVRALMWAGRLPEAERAAQLLLARPLPVEQEGVVRWWLAQAVLQQGRVLETVAVVRAAAEREGISRAQAARFRALEAQALHLMVRLDEAERAAGLAVTGGRQSGDAYATAYGLTTRAAVLLVTRRVEEALDLVDEAFVALGGRETQPDVQLSPHMARGFCLADLDRATEAYEDFREGVRQSESAGGAFLTWHQSAIANLEFLRGNWDDAQTAVQTGLDASDPLDVGPDLRALAAMINIRRGQRTEHTDFVSTAPLDLRAYSYTEYLHRWARAMARDADGDSAGAFQLLESFLWDSDRLTEVLMLDHVFPDAARLAFCLGRTDRLAALEASAREIAAFQPSPNKRGTAALCRGLAEADCSLLTESADAYRSAGRPLFMAFAQENEAVLRARAGQPNQAGTLMSQAVRTYAMLGADWDVRRAEGRLSLEGLTLESRRAPSKAATGWDALTKTEQLVLSMVAEGCSNPQIAERLYVSRRTAQTHVSRVMAKLGKSSRVELAVAAMLRTEA